jgi:branched-subunit amino acid permease
MLPNTTSYIQIAGFPSGYKTMDRALALIVCWPP